MYVDDGSAVVAVAALGLAATLAVAFTCISGVGLERSLRTYRLEHKT